MTLLPAVDTASQTRVLVYPISWGSSEERLVSSFHNLVIPYSSFRAVVTVANGNAMTMEVDPVMSPQLDIPYSLLRMPKAQLNRPNINPKRQTWSQEKMAEAVSMAKRQRISTSSSDKDSIDIPSSVDYPSDFPDEETPPSQDDTACLFCDGLFADDAHGDVWVQCLMCAMWTHKDCAVNDVAMATATATSELSRLRSSVHTLRSVLVSQPLISTFTIPFPLSGGPEVNNCVPDRNETARSSSVFYFLSDPFSIRVLCCASFIGRADEEGHLRESSPGLQARSASTLPIEARCRVMIAHRKSCLVHPCLDDNAG
uniref:Zinc finger PHD-type domain-containing protein n=1 Tax=Timema poppense TaxID=170557 RepID=A0A7R9D0Q3_TIMPO|nr:unnamed protein product [Timema poppensis]